MRGIVPTLATTMKNEIDNGIKSKYYELALMLQRLKPDIICLQETKIKGLKKKTHINGYVIHEVPAGGTSRGLLMGFHNSSNIDFKIIRIIC